LIPAGTDWAVQVASDEALTRTTGTSGAPPPGFSSPTAKQLVVVETHEKSTMPWSVEGVDAEVHVEPPLVVTMMPVPAAVDWRVAQVELLLQAMGPTPVVATGTVWAVQVPPLLPVCSTV
jgi:hypothetical protein